MSLTVTCQKCAGVGTIYTEPNDPGYECDACSGRGLILNPEATHIAHTAAILAYMAAWTDAFPDHGVELSPLALDAAIDAGLRAALGWDQP